MKELKTKIQNAIVVFWKEDNEEEATETIMKLFKEELDKQLLIYSVVGSLPTEDERDSEKYRVRDIILKGIPDLDRVSFGAGFRACFSWFTKRYTK